ncbi:DUF7269 family protein [Haladaptatus cibarius]|uniref:DUF7269 family protein n=1 Tax=Haladaptatus cibarius TaxID=453847 RepID=UPI000B201C47
MRHLGRASQRIRHLLSESISREQLLFGIGVGSLSLAFVVIFAPWAIPESIIRPLVGWIAAPLPIIVIAGVAGVLGLWSVRGEVTEKEKSVWKPRREPEIAYYYEHRTSGADVDDALELQGNLELPSRKRRSRRATARKHVRNAAIQMLTERGYSESDAKQALKDGSWTDDPRAASFLGAPHSDIPLRTRIVDWTQGETFDRGAERAVTELETDDGGSR